MAMVYLTQHSDDWPIPGRQIADALAIPRKYLSNVLRGLVCAGLLEASPGKRGGFRMARDPAGVSLSHVLASLKPLTKSRANCPFGSPVGSDDDPCAGHDRWWRIKEAYQRFLEETSVFDVSISKTAQPKEQIPNGDGE